MRKIITSILIALFIVLGIISIVKIDRELDGLSDLPLGLSELNATNFPSPPNSPSTQIKNIDAEFYVKDSFLIQLIDSVLAHPRIIPLKLKDKKKGELVLEKLESFSFTENNTISCNFRVKLRFSKFFTRTIILAKSTVIELVPLIINEEDFPLDINFAMTHLEIDNIPPGLEKGLAKLATDGLNKMDLKSNFSDLKNLELKLPQSEDIASPDFKIMEFQIDNSGLKLIASIDDE